MCLPAEEDTRVVTRMEEVRAMEEDVMIVTRAANQRPVLRSRDPVLTNERPVFDMCDQCSLCRVRGDWATSGHHCHCTLGK